MAEKFSKDLPEDVSSLSPDTRAIVNALKAFERRTKEREDSYCSATTEKISQLTAAQQDLRKAVEEIASGFPGGDPESHRRYHETVIEWRELRNRMIRDALIQASKVGGFGAIAWVTYAIWTAFKMEIVR